MMMFNCGQSLKTLRDQNVTAMCAICGEPWGMEKKAVPSNDSSGLHNVT
jgi:hypothetical protein